MDKDRLRQLQEVHVALSQHLQTAQSTHKEAADHHRLNFPSKEQKFQIGDRVLRRNVNTTKPCDKLNYQRLGSFIISNQINDVAIRLDMPPQMPPIFHVSLLEPYIGSSIPYRVVLPPHHVQLIDGPKFVVKTILNSNIVHKKLDYLMDWLGYAHNDRT